MSNNRSSNRSNATKDPGIYTCPTCNALFTCLKFYQQHVTQHAEMNQVKLYCCNICRFSTEKIFEYNWHQMSHKNAPPHSCNVCQDTDTYNNHLNGNDNATTGRRRSQQNGNSNKKVKYSNNKVQVKNEPQEEDEEEDETDDSNESVEAESDEEVDEEADGEEDEEESDEADEDDESEEVDEEASQQMQIQQNVSSNNNQLVYQRTIQQDQDDISEDEEDDEEEEIESEVDSDNDGNNELPEEYLVAQRLNTETNSSYQYNDIQNQNNATSHLNNNQSNASNNLVDVNQGPPYTKSAGDLSNDILSNDGIIICTKGRGKGNRKSRTINQMGGQVDDETSQSRRKFHCSHCGKSFKTKSHLQRHILTHTGEKPYHCNRCGAKFNQSSSLRNHIIALHTKEYPHFCNHCQKGFLMPALLTKHLQTSHRGDPGEP